MGNYDSVRLKAIFTTIHKIIKTPTLQTYISYILSKLKRTRNQMTSDLYVLNWKSSYDVMLLMYQRRQQDFAEF
jgi:hypothetical protein